MRTIPPIRHDVFTDPSEREVIKTIADALRQVNGGMAKSVLPGQNPSSNPVPSTSNPKKSSAGAVPGTFLLSEGDQPLWVNPADPSSPTTTGFVTTAGHTSGPQTITTPTAGHGVLKLQRCPAPSSGAFIMEITDEVGNPLADIDENGAWAGDILASYNSANLPDLTRFGTPVIAAVLDVSAVSTDRTLTIRDLTGTIALLSDIAGLEGTVDLFNQLNSIGATNLVPSTSAAGMYRVSAYAKVTTAGGAADTLAITIGWNDGSAQAQYVMMDFDQVSGQPTTAVNLGTNNHPFTGAIDIYATSASAITYATTVVKAGAPAYTLRLRAQRIG